MVAGSERVGWGGSGQSKGLNRSLGRHTLGGQTRGPHPGLDVLGPPSVGQGVPGLLKGAAGWADVGDHHGAAVPPQGILDGWEDGARVSQGLPLGTAGAGCP